MPDVRTFFRHCPSCGRRFEIRLVSKEELGSVDFSDKRSDVGVSVAPVRSVQSVVVSQEKPNVVDIEEFQYRYKCKHCGHEWTEVREKERSLGEFEGYTGD